MSNQPVEPGLAVLALGTFAIGTDGFVIAGILPEVAQDTGVTLSAAGLLVTAFALVYGVAAPLLTAAVARIDRRTVLLTGMAVLTAANAGAALAMGYRTLMAARIFAALGGALYSPVAMSTAAQLAPPLARARAIALVLGGMTAALVAGVPLGALVATVGSWRWTFALVAVIAAACTLGITRLLPPVPASPVSSLRARVGLLRRVAVLGNLTATFLWITGAFVLYTYIADALATSTDWRGATISALLLLYGAAAFAGNSIGGRAADRWGPAPTVIVGLCSLMLTLSAAGWACYLGPPAGRPIMALVMLAWPLAGWALTPAQSHRLLEVAPTAGPEVLSLNTSAVYFGIAAGAAVGGYVVHRHDIAWLGPVAAAFQLLALAILLALGARPLSSATVLASNATDTTTGPPADRCQPMGRPTAEW